MTGIWQRSLLFRAVASIVAITLVVGGLLVAGLSVLVTRNAQAEAYKRLGELIDTVESTVRIACFVGDEQLATEVARGLLKTPEIRAVHIRSERATLTHLDRSGRPPPPSPTVNRPLERQMPSPFDDTQIVGTIVLYPDSELIDRSIATSTGYIASQLGLLIAAVAVALTLTVFRLIIRPLTDLSQRVHSLDAESGARLAPPLSHEHNQLGVLTTDINALTARLVDTIRAEQTLRLCQEIDERKYRGIFENAESGIFVADEHGHLQSYNRSLARLSGLPPPETPQEQSATLTKLNWAEPAAVRQLLSDCLMQNQATAGDFALELTSGTRWLNIALTAIGSGLVQGIVSDVSERRAAEQRARQQAITDPLTGLPNRQGFEQHWAAQTQRAPHAPCTLLIADLDGFRQINDAIGFTAGDQLLATVARRLQAELTPDACLARLGADDFALALPGQHSLSALETLACQLLATIAEPMPVGDSTLGLGVSIGVARYPDDGETLPLLLRNAELALAQAQANGGQTWRRFEPAMVQAIEQRHQLANELRHAVERDELRLHYQPIIDLHSHRVSGAECLVRWQHPLHGLLAPDSFIPLAEETGSINELGLWCLRTACQQLRAWEQQGLDLTLTVNVSACQIPEGLPPAQVQSILDQYGLAAGRIGLEITESTLIGDTQAVNDWLATLRTQGNRIYLDDFGTGYSSLSYLKALPVDTIKIDRAFIRDLDQEGHDRVLVEAVTMMADSLHLSVVAEGIETPQQLALLRQLGCRYGQGYLFSRPVPAEQLPATLTHLQSSGLL